MDPEVDPRFVCAVCCEVFKRPVVIRACRHRFCEDCMRRAPCSNDGTLTCPMCRAMFQFDVRGCCFDRELELEIARATVVCSACKQQCSLMQFDRHSATCSSRNRTLLPTHQPAAAAAAAAAPQPLQNRSTFRCPLCPTANLDCKSLLEHVNALHATSKTPVVCPVCVAMPWGDTAYTSQNFVQHLNLRHKFEYETFVDYERDDAATLEAVLEASQFDR